MKKNFSIRRFFINPRKKALISALLVFTVSLVLLGLISRRDEHLFLGERRLSTKGELDLYGNALTVTLNSYFGLLESLYSFSQVEYASTPAHISDTFNNLAREFSKSAPGIRNFSIAPNGIQGYVYPLEGNEGVLGHDLLNDERPAVRADVERAIETRKIVLNGPYELRQGGLGLVARQAVYVDGEFWGLVAMVVDVPPLLDNAGISAHNEHLIFALEDKNDEVFFGESEILAQQPIRYEILLPDGHWTLSAIHRDGWHVSSPQKALIQIGGLILSILLAAITYLLVNRDERLRYSVDEKTQALRDVVRELDKSREYFQEIISKSPVPMVITDSKGDIEYYNHRFTETFGYTLDDIATAEEWWNAIYPDKNYRLLVQESWGKAIEDARARGTQIATQEWDLTCKDRSVRRVEIDMMPLGEIFVIAMDDITARKKKEEALRESETRLRRYFDQKFLGMAITSADKFWIQTNDALCDMFGYSHEELSKLTWAEVTDPGYLDTNIQFYEQALKGEIDNYSLEKRFIRKDGSVFYAELSANVVRKDDGSVDYLITLINDITERKEADEALKASHERMLTILNSIPANVYVSDMKSYKILFANDHMRKDYGTEILGEVYYKALRNESEQCSICPSKRLLDASGETAEKIIWESQSPITKRWYVNYDRAVRWTDGSLVYVQISIDITERKEAEGALQKLNNELDQRVEKRTRELNNIVSLMSGREVRMAELKKVITVLRTQLKEAGLEPSAFDPLLGPDEEW